jgi:flavin-dependent dehydrogenase
MDTTPTSETPIGAAAAGAPPRTSYDAIFIGAAFSSASCALLLKRRRPEARILLVEARDHGERKIGEVGEATVEVSGCFLHRNLGLYDHLSREHLPKHGLRYWFTDGPDRNLREMSEVGPTVVPPLPSFQLDRGRLDEHLLSLAEDAGCEVLRPAKVEAVDTGWPITTVEVTTAEGPRSLTTRWLLDGSGRRTFLARHLGLKEREERHPVAALWSRWEGVLDLDSAEMLTDRPGAPGLPATAAARRLATNHFCGYGWWCWVIPLASGRTSIGLVYDKTLLELPGSGPSEGRYAAFLRAQPGLRELLAEAHPVEGEFMAYSHLPYRCQRYMDRGWGLLGDAAAFIDPFYSPGLDHAVISAFATTRIVAADLEGAVDEEGLDELMGEHNAQFRRSYDRWLLALYENKYELMGDAELMACTYLVDTALYYLGVVTPVYTVPEALANPILGLPNRSASIAYRILRLFNRRMLHIARVRRSNGTYGRRNIGWRLTNKPFGLRHRTLSPLFQGLRLWLRLELSAVGGRWRSGGSTESLPATESAAT